MAEFIIILLIVFGVIAVAVLVFGAWIVVMVVRGFGRALGLLPTPAVGKQGRYQPGAAALAPPRPGNVRCDRSLCHAESPAGVRYCRRCGNRLNVLVAAPSPLPQLPQRRGRRAAML